MSNEEASSVSEAYVEPAPINLQSNIPPRAGVSDCVMIPPGSLISLIRLATGEEARLDTAGDDEIGGTANA